MRPSDRRDTGHDFAHRILAELSAMRAELSAMRAQLAVVAADTDRIDRTLRPYGDGTPTHRDLRRGHRQ